MGLPACFAFLVLSLVLFCFLVLFLALFSCLVFLLVFLFSDLVFLFSDLVISFSFQLSSFDKRQAELDSFVRGTKYVVQKRRLRLDFEKFLSVRSVCPPPLATAPSFAAARPIDIVRFMHHRDQAGRTHVHKFDCPNFGKSGLWGCGCPRHFAAGTVASYVGQLRAEFRDLGLQEHLNPCNSPTVKEWVAACAKEQQRHRVPIKQAKPIFSPHLRLLVTEIKLQIALLPPGPLFPHLFPLLRDWLFFTTQWFCGDRAGDLGRALTQEVVRLEDGSLLYHHTVGKTIRSADGQLLVVPKVEDDQDLCPVAAFDRYVSACRAHQATDPGFSLRNGYLFPPMTPDHTSIRNVPFSSTAANKRLSHYLPGEDLTVHGARGGCAITLFMLGASSDAVREHCRWASEEVCRHYTKLDRVRRLDSSARLLQAGVSVAGGVSETDSAAHLYELLNSGFTQEAAY